MALPAGNSAGTGEELTEPLRDRGADNVLPGADGVLDLRDRSLVLRPAVGAEASGTSERLADTFRQRQVRKDGAVNFFFEMRFRRMLPRVLVLEEDERSERIIRKDLWAKFGQPMHFWSLEFEDDFIEAEFQMDSTRRNKRWVRYTLLVRTLLESAVVIVNLWYLWRQARELRSSALCGGRSPSWVFCDGWDEDRYAAEGKRWAAQAMFLVGFHFAMLLLYFLQYMQLRADQLFVHRQFQHVIFFWANTHVVAIYFFVLLLAPRTFVQVELCNPGWVADKKVLATEVDVLHAAQAAVEEQIVVFVLTCQIVYRMRFLYFLYINVMLVVVQVLRYALVKQRFGTQSPCLPKNGEMRFMILFSMGLVFLNYNYEMLQRKDFIQASMVYEESRRSERLLENVLPKPVISELKLSCGKRSVVKRYDCVSVLFADIVSFTTMSAGLSPDTLVSLLDRMFLSFDDLAESNGVEKIKTIGDCYMAAAGVPVETDEHAHRIARFGLGMLAVMTSGIFRNPNTGDVLRVRVGMHSGPAVAGVIGNTKFCYDLWGDAVNTASRMESHGQPTRLHCSADTFKLLSQDFHCEDRGPMQVKGKGEMRTYFVVRERLQGESRDEELARPQSSLTSKASGASSRSRRSVQINDVPMSVENSEAATRRSVWSSVSGFAAQVSRAVSSLGYEVTTVAPRGSLAPRPSFRGSTDASPVAGGVRPSLRSADFTQGLVGARKSVRSGDLSGHASAPQLSLAAGHSSAPRLTEMAPLQEQPPGEGAGV